MFHSIWSETTQIPKFALPKKLGSPHLTTKTAWTQIEYLLNKSRTAHYCIWKQLNVICMMPKTTVFAKTVIYLSITTEEMVSRIRAQPNNCTTNLGESKNCFWKHVNGCCRMLKTKIFLWKVIPLLASKNMVLQLQNPLQLSFTLRQAENTFWKKLKLDWTCWKAENILKMQFYRKFASARKSYTSQLNSIWCTSFGNVNNHSWKHVNDGQQCSNLWSFPTMSSLFILASES